MNELMIVQNELAKARLACAGVRDDLDPEDSSRTLAKKHAMILMGGFPQQKNNDDTFFARHFELMFKDYPADIIEEAALKLPQEIEGWLTVKKAKDWLERRMTARRDHLQRRYQEMEAAEKRAKDAEGEAERERDREKYRAWCKANPGKTIWDYTGVPRPGGPASKVVDDIAKAYEGAA